MRYLSTVWYALIIFFVLPSCKTDEDSTFIKPLAPIYDSFVDSRDRRVYSTVTLWHQTWMAENLKYIPGIGKVDSQRLIQDYRVYGYEGLFSEMTLTEHFENFGVLYSFESALESCPRGWRLPRTTDWESLFRSLGEASPGLIKSDIFWDSGLKGNNKSGMNILPGGSYYFISGFHNLLKETIIWTSTFPEYHDMPFDREVLAIDSEVSFQLSSESNGHYVRCIKTNNNYHPYSIN